MKAGIQYADGLSVEKICENGFREIELSIKNYDKLDEIKAAGVEISGVVFRLRNMVIEKNEKEVSKDILKENAAEEFKNIVDKAIECNASYIVVETEGVNEAAVLEELVNESSGWLGNINIAINIENGYTYCNNRFYHNEYSDSTVLVSLVKRIRLLCSSIDWKICLNIGHSNLLGINIRDMIKTCKGYIGLVHVNDNDGIKDMHQMPYTFTTGRGYPSTDWVHAIGMLCRCGYDGYYIFDTKGLWKRIPVQLQHNTLRLLKSVAEEWNENCYRTGEYLNQSGKKLILFGSGRMAQSYMEAWGELYRPDFIVDNDAEKWGQRFMGIPIKPPEEILSLVPDERNVWICNLNYEIIGKQLEDMGIQYKCYWDHYHMDYIV